MEPPYSSLLPVKRGLKVGTRVKLRAYTSITGVIIAIQRYCYMEPYYTVQWDHMGRPLNYREKQIKKCREQKT
jgi:hypothetical protein